MFQNKYKIIGLTIVLFTAVASHAQEITPHKFEGDYVKELRTSSYVIPSSSRFTAPRSEQGAPEIVYYLTKPAHAEKYPIALLCGGSTNKDNVGSIIHFHRYLLQEFLDLNVAVATVEQWGVDGKSVDEKVFFEHYTRTQRLKDHEDLIHHLQNNKPNGWDGTFVLLGVSEGGPLVTTLTEGYSDVIRATINWVGAGDWSWKEELWAFLITLRKNGSWWLKLWDLVPAWIPFSLDIPKTKKEFDQDMQKTIADPCVDKDFMGMTYLYHADALQYPAHDYTKIKAPFLSVIGSEDPMIESADAFAQKAKEAGVNITYLRVDGMDHYVRHRPDIVEQSFEWLKQKLSD